MQSTPPEEGKVGIETLERQIRPIVEGRELPVNIKVIEPKTKEDLILSLNSAYHDYKKSRIGQDPVVFMFDCHGLDNKKGLSLASGEPVYWEELAPHFRALTELANLNTIYVFGACHGIYGLDTVRNTERAPFFACFGPKRIISAYRLSQFYRDLVQSIIMSGNIRDTVKQVMPNYRDDIEFHTATFFFAKTWQGYMSNTEQFERRRKRLLKKIKKLDIPPLEKKAKLEDVCKNFPHHEFFFNDFKRKFLLLDKYPENEERFKDLTFEAVKNGYPNHPTDKDDSSEPPEGHNIQQK